MLDLLNCLWRKQRTLFNPMFFACCRWKRWSSQCFQLFQDIYTYLRIRDSISQAVLCRWTDIICFVLFADRIATKHAELMGPESQQGLQAMPGASERIVISVQSKPEEFDGTNFDIQHDVFLASSELQFRCSTVGWPASSVKLRRSCWQKQFLDWVGPRARGA